MADADIRNLYGLLKATAEKFPQKPALLSKVNHTYASLSWSEVLTRAESTALGLMSLGVKTGDRVAILSENRPEWAILDLACQTIGAVSVPIYTSLAAAEIQYILRDSEAVLMAVSTKDLLEKFSLAQDDLPALKTIVAFDGACLLVRNDVKAALTLLKDVEKKRPLDDRIEKLAGSIPGEAIATLIYTSGTTGVPKGVMLTHQNFIQNVLLAKTTLRMLPTDVHLSFLPLSHVFERMAGHYLMIHIGATVAYAESMDKVSDNLLEVRPTFLLGVPRFFEKIKNKVLDNVEKASVVRRGIFYWAKSIGAAHRDKKGGGPARGLAKLLVYNKFKRSLGGRIRFCISGGAPLPKETAEFFADLGIMIYEGYGLSETSPVISVNREGRYRFGSVGIPLDGVEVRITAEGEIATKSPCVMTGYYKKPAETAEVLKDKWFYTGDLGRIDKDGFLFITGRKKELIVTSGGKKVAPRAIEEKLEEDPYILRCVLYGEGKRFLTALIVPSREKLEEYAQTKKIAYDKYKDLLASPLIYQLIESRIDGLSKDLASFEKIKYFTLLEFDFSQASGELTPTLKVKRDVVIARYKDLLEAFYKNAG